MTREELDKHSPKQYDMFYLDKRFMPTDDIVRFIDVTMCYLINYEIYTAPVCHVELVHNSKGENNEKCIIPLSYLTLDEQQQINIMDDILINLNKLEKKITKK